MIDKLLQYFIPSVSEHLSDDRLASLFCGDLTFKERVAVKRHLGLCPYCRFRQADLVERRAEEAMEFYQAVKNRRDLNLAPEPRVEFAEKLQLHVQQLSMSPQQHVLPARRSGFRLRFAVAPVFVAVVLCAVVSVSFFAFHRQRAPQMTTDAFLIRATRGDDAKTGGRTGVAYQSVRITAPKVTLERALYRDLQGRRTPRTSEPAGRQKQLRDELMRAGVDWDEPISARDYQTWLAKQHGQVEEITRSGDHLLKLTASSSDAQVSSESLTVRDTDFHPVRRTIAVRDLGVVEIAELDFRILPWSEVSESVFEPLITASPAAVPSRARVEQPLMLPRSITPDELDEAELNARLVLNQLHADSGEQIEIRRLSQEVLVEGVVETEERKRQLQTQLILIPHVKPSIQSVIDLRSIPSAERATSMTVASMPDLPSALELSMRKRGHSLAESNALAQRLANTALTISQESKAIADLQTHFTPNAGRTVLASATLSELIYSHREQLVLALKNERALLTELQGGAAGMHASADASAADLLSSASRNLGLLKELTQTDHAPDRGAEEIFTQMLVSLDAVGSAANDVFKKTQSNTALNGRK